MPLNARNGETVWTYATGNKIFSAPSSLPNWWLSLPRRVYSCTGQKQGSACWKFNTDYPIVACPTVANGNVYTGSSNGKFTHPPGKRHAQLVTDGLNGYIESRLAIDHERIYISEPGSHVLCHRPENREKKYGIRHRTRKILLREPLLAHSAALPEEWKASEQVIVLSSDYFVRAFNPKTEKSWHRMKRKDANQSVSRWKDQVQKGIKNNITAADVSKRKLHSTLEYIDAV